MAFAQRTAIWLLAPLVLLTGPILTEGNKVFAEDKEAAGDPAGRTWHGPAAATAEAAATQATKQASKEAVVPPAPKPVERPAAEAPSQKAAAKDASPPASKAAAPTDKAPAAKGDAKSAKEKDKPKKPVISAKQLFGTVKTGAPLAARAVGWYAKGCLAGAKPLAVDGPGWQVMRLSRNRMWGHPDLVALVERLARESTEKKEWSGLLVGDISQPRGGPMISGHASHQVGLDADIWLTPMPDRKLTRREREDLSATSMLASYNAVNPKVWGEGQVKLIKRAASYPAVERILVHPAIKKALCEATDKKDRAWLSKVRPYFGHYYHFHMRIGCPKGSANCQHQPPVPGDDGCEAELKDWLKKVAPKPKPKPPVEAAKPPAKPAKPAPRKPEITLADLPADCKAVLTAGGNVPPTEPAEVVDTSKNAAPPPEKDFAATDAAPTSENKTSGDKASADTAPTKKAAQ
jgi:penicillin-insensitive murein endopeptidase